MPAPTCPNCYGEDITVRTTASVNVRFNTVTIDGVGFWGDEYVTRNVVDIIKPKEVKILPEDLTQCNECDHFAPYKDFVGE